MVADGLVEMVFAADCANLTEIRNLRKTLSQMGLMCRNWGRNISVAYHINYTTSRNQR
jgi:hypothetical protein